MSVFFPSSLIALCVYVYVWVLVHVSYLQTCLPVCLGRGNHYAYYGYRHHEGKNPQHLLLCLLLLLMELLLGPQQILIRNPPLSFVMGMFLTGLQKGLFDSY